MKNEMTLHIKSLSENEAFARSTVAAFCAQVNPRLEDIIDIKTAVSEAVTNCIVHGYRDCIGIITIECEIVDREITITVSDEGVGIPDVNLAMTPMYTTKPEEERSGMGFSFMEIFMDELKVESENGVGTVVTMKKRIM